MKRVVPGLTGFDHAEDLRDFVVHQRPVKKNRMIHKVLLALLVIPTLYGCATGFNVGVSFTDIVPIPVPQLDTSLRSVAYYKNEYSVDLLRMNHNMSEEIRASREATDQANKLIRFKVNGQDVKSPYNDKHLYSSKKIGPNDYLVTTSKIMPIDRQIGDDYCWAASIKYFLSREFNVTVSQRRIVDAIKKDQPSGEQAASVMEIMKSLGFARLKLTPGGSQQLIGSLGRDHVAIMGIKNKNRSVGHVVIVVAARYSFVNYYHPALPPTGNIAISEIAYLDPADGKLITM